MNAQWALASEKASLPMKWYDRMAIAILVAAACLAVLGWAIFDGTAAL